MRIKKKDVFYVCVGVCLVGSLIFGTLFFQAAAVVAIVLVVTELLKD